MTSTDHPTLIAAPGYHITCELLRVLGEDERTAKRIEIEPVSGGVLFTVERITQPHHDTPGEPRPSERRSYLAPITATPEPRIEGTWLVEDVGRCTCAGGAASGTSAHEPGCGLDPARAALRMRQLPDLTLMCNGASNGVTNGVCNGVSNDCPDPTRPEQVLTYLPRWHSLPLRSTELPRSASLRLPSKTPAGLRAAHQPNPSQLGNYRPRARCEENRP